MLGHLYVKSPSAAGAHTDPQRAGPVVSQLPYLRPKFTVQGLCSPCGSAPPLLSLTRIASILALVKLTSSLNYANKAIVICICTASWYAARGGVGVMRGCESKHRLIQRFQCTQTNIYALRHICTVGSHGDGKKQPRVRRAGCGTFQLCDPTMLGFIDFRLNGWCRCRAQTSALLCRCDILLGNKHQPGCQREQLLLFKAVSFKGDELE